MFCIPHIPDIRIPDTSEEVLDIYKYDNYNNYNNNTYDWDIVDLKDFSEIVNIPDFRNIENIYEDLEEYIYSVESCFYKPYYSDGTRILVKKIEIEDTKRLYILSKQFNLWFRSHIDLKINDNDSLYYDFSWK